MATPKPIFIIPLKVYYQYPFFAAIELKFKDIKAKFTVSIFWCQRWDMMNDFFKEYLFFFESHLYTTAVLTNFICNLSHMLDASLKFLVW